MGENQRCVVLPVQRVWDLRKCKGDFPLSAIYGRDKIPGISTVVIEQDSIDISSEKEIEEALHTSEVISFDESSVSFNPEIAELVDPVTAGGSLNEGAVYP